MMTFQAKYLDKPDDLRTFNNGEMSVVELSGVTVGRGVLQPGWRWSNDVKPVVGTESCQEAHTMYVLSGRLHILMDDGEEGEIEAGEAGIVSPGHDAWVVGEEPFVAIDWSGAATYAKPSG
jgi:mannose-6-phosphate isomerase-like protein (cupin superfamily)